jgi:NTE family protein
MMMSDEKRFNMRSFVDAKLGIVRFMIFSLSRGPGLISNILISYLAIAALALIILPLLSYAGVDIFPAYLIFMSLFDRDVIGDSDFVVEAQPIQMVLIREKFSKVF